MRRCLTTLLLSIGILFLLSPFVQAADLGCCEIKNTPDDGTRVFEDKSEAECKQIDLNNISKFTIFHPKQQVSGDKKNCVNKSTNAVDNNTKKQGDPIYFTPGVSIPESDFTSGKSVEVKESTLTLVNYIVAIFKYSTGVIGIIAAIALMIGGIIWLTAGGSHEKVASARTLIGSSLVGMCIAFSAFLLLSLVNTNLVNFKVMPITKIQYISVDNVCALKTANDGSTTAANIPKEECEQLKTTVDANNPDAYSAIECLKDHNAQANKCVRLYGCCEVEVVDWSFLSIVEGSRKEAYCLNKIKQADCTDKSGSFWSSAGKAWGGYIVGGVIGSVIGQNKGDELTGNDHKINTTFHDNVCQQVEECADSENGVIY